MKTANFDRSRPRFFPSSPLLIIAVLYAVLLVFLVRSISLASPPPDDSQAVLGVGIGQYSGEWSGGRYVGTHPAYFSGKRLDCESLGDMPLSSRCTTTIFDETLEIIANRNHPDNPLQLGGQCQAFYDGKEWPCEVASRHVHIHWFVYLDNPLGLEESQLDQLKRTYYIENLPQTTFLQGSFLLSILNAVIGASIVGLYIERFAKPKKEWRGFVSSASGLVTGFGIFFTSVIYFVTLTNPFWD